jgi:hypothetical protein
MNRSALFAKSIGPGAVCDSPFYNDAVWDSLELALNRMHAEFPGKRAMLEAQWSIRPTQNTRGGDSLPEEDAEAPLSIEFRESHRAKWVKFQNTIYDEYRQIVFCDNTHIDAGWNYLLVWNEPDANFGALLDLLNYRYVNYGVVLQILQNRQEEVLARINRMPMPPCERQVCRTVYEEVDQELEIQHTKEEEPDNWRKNRETFDRPLEWEFTLLA